MRLVPSTTATVPARLRGAVVVAGKPAAAVPELLPAEGVPEADDAGVVESDAGALALPGEEVD